MQAYINTYIISYVKILHRLFKESHIPDIGVYKYAKIALTINDILLRMKSDYNIVVVMAVIYKVSVLTCYSFGPICKTMKQELLNYGGVVTNTVNVSPDVYNMIYPILSDLI